MTELIGNKPAAEVIRRLLASGRVPNALLFAGPEGVGKKQFAIELARSLVCTSDGCEACRYCSACKRAGEFAIPVFEKGDESDYVFFSQHPDVGMVVPFRRNLRINAIRALESEAHFQPFEANARVFIVDDAEKMNDAASNALLKTLEEPSPTSHIILIAARPDSLLPTIRSRAQTVRFAPVGATEIETFLIATQQLEPEDAALAARVSGGSVSRAMGIVPASFRTQRSLMLEVLHAAAANDKRSLLAASEQMTDAKFKEEFEEKLEILRGLIHDVWLLKNGADEAGILNADVLGELQLLNEQLANSDLPSWLAEIEAMHENFIVNINKKVATDAMLMKMVA